MNKGEICKMLEGVGALEAGKYDTALPQSWMNEVEKLGIDPRFSFVWSYSEDRVFGKPVNISVLFIEHFGEKVKLCEYYQRKEGADA